MTAPLALTRAFVQWQDSFAASFAGIRYYVMTQPVGMVTSTDAAQVEDSTGLVISALLRTLRELGYDLPASLSAATPGKPASPLPDPKGHPNPDQQHDQSREVM